MSGGAERSGGSGGSPAAAGPTASKPSAATGGYLSVVSLFSGCGGMDLGFAGGFEFLGRRYPETGMEVVWANDANPAACDTYRLNFGDRVVTGDVYAAMASMPPSADLVIGGFPCQDISVNGKMLGLDGKRSALYAAIVETVGRLGPRAFVAENVGGILMKRHAAAFAKILSDFGDLGYSVHARAYQAADYGVPQTRTRVFIVGTRADQAAFRPPRPTAGKRVTAREAIGDLEALEADPGFSHVWSLARESPEQGSRRLLADRPGFTVRAECHGNIHFHYSLPRRISMREAARLQSFPDGFRFASKLRETERQIGNAVPPVLAWHVAAAVKAALEGLSPLRAGNFLVTERFLAQAPQGSRRGVPVV
ncbi:MAG: DNA cytosine methyltransferase [Deltaproteobacteria bacterium]|nr:DNA cytosine methyltransferase [Deltaproteobacteria bacterium]